MLRCEPSHSSHIQQSPVFMFDTAAPNPVCNLNAICVYKHGPHMGQLAVTPHRIKFNKYFTVWHGLLLVLLDERNMVFPGHVGELPHLYWLTAISQHTK